MTDYLTVIVNAFGIGLTVWFLTYGFNRVYLRMKSLLS